jgi:hypothetical protein
MDNQEWLRVFWPLSVVADRYGGTYSRGEWSAWPLLPSEVPAAISGDDVEARQWWEAAATGSVVFGIGSSPEGAIADLKQKMSRG